MRKKTFAVLKVAAIAVSILTICHGQVVNDAAIDFETLLTSDDQAQWAIAKDRLNDSVSNRKVPKELRNIWLPALMKKKRFEDVAEYALKGAIASPDARNAAVLLELRAKALLELARGESTAVRAREALAAAKQSFNVCEIKETERGIAIVSECLVKVHRDDASATFRRFRIEQALVSGAEMTGPELATTGETETGRQANKEGAGAPHEAVLKGVTIDESVFVEAISRWSKNTSFKDQLVYGNLLLMADRGKEAEAVFRKLYEKAASQQDKELAAEAIGRALRAEDGNMGRANVWLAKVQKELGGF